MTTEASSPVTGFSDAVLDVLCTRSTVRCYSDKPVDDMLLDRMIDATLAAPSAANRQAWSFIVVREHSNLRRVRAFAPGVLGNPAAIVIACVDENLSAEDPGGGPGLMCLAMAVENLLLAAHAYGLGACPVSSFSSAPLSLTLGLPDHVKPVFVVPIGYPARASGSPRRRNRDEVISYETWGRHDGSPSGRG